MWTAKLLEASDRKTHWKMVFEFTNGTDTITDGFRFKGATSNDLKAFARQQAAALDKVETSIDFKQFVGKSIDISPPVVTPPDPPTPDELAKQAWFADYSELKRINHLFEQLPSLATPERVATRNDLRVSLTAGWKNSYLNKVI